MIGAVPMHIRDYFGSLEANDAATLIVILSRRYGEGYNGFWLSHVDQFPAISILVKDEMAYLHYFPEDRHPGFHSYSDPPIWDRETIEFRLDNLSQKQQVDGEAVVPFAVALTVAKEFLASSVRPKSVNWREL
jgi:hypothetical protein